tara:strand:- start:46071 stop:47102 length:1032 start_codon:yes stop_codon:yes gene_type:complete
MLNNKSILITGGTGSFGQAFVSTILKKYPKVKRLVVFSRDELKQFEMSKKFPENKYPAIRYFLGDVRDRERVKRAVSDIDIVVHAAALKQVPAAEYNPMEFIKTNIIGATNIIEACIDANVKKVVALSTDKAAAPINLYGATKLCSDKLFVAANNYSGRNKLRLSVVRYGNVMGSRGSVIPYFIEQKKTGTLTITDKSMTRFNITLDQSINLVLWAIKKSVGGEIYVPKLPSYRILDLAKAISPDSKTKVIGVRPGEKIHEEMITDSDSFATIDIGKYYVILPSGKFTITGWPKETQLIDYYLKKMKAKKVKKGFTYNSGENSNFLTVAQLKNLIEENVEHNG